MLKKLIIPLLSLLCLYCPLEADVFIPNYDVRIDNHNSYRFPTERYLSKHPLSEVRARLIDQEIYLQQIDFYDQLKHQEEPGHIGYHAASHQFRVFQDIIRMVYEEVLGLEFKKDFYFFRLPGDPSLHDYRYSNIFLSHFPQVNDNLPEQRDQLISVNFTLFNNYDMKYECTPVFFELARSFKPPSFEQKISLLFDLAGMDHEDISTLFEIGKMIEHPDGGVMFQIFDLSYQAPQSNTTPYGILDEMAYACVKKGVPTFPGHRLSDLYKENHESDFLSQYRLVVNHGKILNPYSELTIRRYDLNEHAVVKEYEQQMRKVIKSIPFDPIQANIYKNKLMQYWKNN